MDNIWAVLGLALLPALGNFAGGLLAERFPVSQRQLNLALHAAAGVVLAVVAVELMPEALAAIAGWAVALAFGLGGLAYVAIESLVDRLQGDDQRQGVDPLLALPDVDDGAHGLSGPARRRSR